ncbi:putative entry exclusion protein TrbK-alt [Paracoccus saliphilus]|uniref:Conjugative transfer region protein TrbK n=1 Tax=Paracoccus saliphilus TaxID=405559 RepID=A0AA46A7J7_9RHOB|nr:putative entry exclusion protein TrbK-alt [Paracoccus saliphilus]WCR05517.1 putative entry exclusion protein TrbK-alt [Paracoccus saliphilus]SIT14930.1 conjugative transfer region protein TrbK [Paracoccus saliphilus]
MHDRFWPRLLAILLLAGAMTATVVRMSGREELPAPPGPEILVPPEDPLREGLRRCQRMGEEAANDADCLGLWAETRDRFLGRDAGPAFPQDNEGQ